MNTTEVAVPQPWRDLMQERKDRITALEQKNAKLVAALKLCEHKIDQHLQGQYPNGQALGAALQQARAVLKELGE